MHTMNTVSVIAEVVVAALGIMLVVRKKKIYGWSFVLTFGIYIFYDLTRFFDLSMPDATLAVLFLVASLSILCGTWQIYREG